MKKPLLLSIILLLIVSYAEQNGIALPDLSSITENSGSRLETAFKNHQSDLQIQGSGVVKRILPDDLRGSRHQRFIIKLDTGLAVLVAHNIDLSGKIQDLQKGDQVAFYGEYEWNTKGGVIHWTHRDPRGKHINGWLEHNGKTYQ